MPDKNILDIIISYISSVPVVDTHEHIALTEKEYIGQKADFCRFFTIYTLEDLLSSGLSMPAREEFFNTGGNVLRVNGKSLSLDDKWQYLAPFWENTKNTGYGQALRLSISKLFGIDDLNTGTYTEISCRLSEMMNPGVYRKIINDVCGITHIVNDTDFYELSMSDWEKSDRTFFLKAGRFQHFSRIFKRSDIFRLENMFGINIRSLDGLLEALDMQFGWWEKNGRITVKFADAYLRDLNYEDTPHEEAERSLCKIFSLKESSIYQFEESLNLAEARPLQNFIVHRILEKMERTNIPAIVHTGYQAGLNHQLELSKASNLTPLFIKYPNVRFLLLHSGYPWMDETICLAKQFANVHLNLAWTQIIVPEGAREGLSRMIDMVPVNKIQAFGGDYGYPENIPGHLEMARENVACVLADKIEKGIMTENQAMETAERFFNKNATDFFGLT